MEARVVGAETRAEIAEEKVRFISCWRLVKVILCWSLTIYRRPRNQSGEYFKTANNIRSILPDIWGTIYVVVIDFFCSRAQ